MRTGILYVEGPEDLVRRRERDRTVSEAVIDRMLHKWEVPTPLETHELVLLVHEGQKTARRATPLAA